MAGQRIPWVLTNQTTLTTFTSDVLSASMTTGRQTYMDVYNGGGLLITINNDSSQADNFTMNDQIILAYISGGLYYRQYFRVDEIQFTDYPGDTGLNTATISCSDAIARLGRRFVNNQALTQTTCAAQAAQFNNGTGPTITAYEILPNSIASAINYTGAPMQRINQLINTDRGKLIQYQDTLQFFSRTAISSYQAAGAFRRSPTSVDIGYQEFTRTSLGQNFMNTVEVTPTGGAAQVGTNATSVAAYGSNYYSLQSEDYTNAQALGLAEYLANSQSDPTALRYEIAFTDRAQNMTALQNFLLLIKDPGPFTLEVLLPGSSSVEEVSVSVEGYTIDITPAESSFRVSLSPMTYYQFFTLNSNTLGILNTSRLGW